MTTEIKTIIGIIIATVVILGGGVWFLSTQDTKEQTKEQVKINKSLMGEAIPIQGDNHIPEGEKAEYNSNPPTSGPHYAKSQAGGIYDKPVPDGNLLHSMEHGAVILWYKTGINKSDIEKLKNIFSNVPVSKKIMVPRDSIDVPVALTSWGRLLKLQKIDENQIKTFMMINEDRGPEKAPL